MLDHEERFLFREEIHNLANALADPGQLDNVEDLLAEVTTSPRFDADVFTLERSLQVMLGGRAGSTLVGLLTVDRGVFEELGEMGLPPDVHERLVSWRARFGLVIDNALNFLNNPDGIQGHNFGTQLSHTRGRPDAPGPADPGPLQQRAPVLHRRCGRALQRGRRHARAARRAPRAGHDRRRPRDPSARGRGPRRATNEGARPGLMAAPAAPARRVFLAATGQNRGKTTTSLGLMAGRPGAGPAARLPEAGRPAVPGHRRHARR